LKSHLSKLLNTVKSGQEVVITRYGYLIAREAPADTVKQPLPLARLAKLRQQLLAREGSSANALRELLDAA